MKLLENAIACCASRPKGGQGSIKTESRKASDQQEGSAQAPAPAPELARGGKAEVLTIEINKKKPTDIIGVE